MGMPWVRLDSTFPHNKKVLALVDRRQYRAVSAYVFALAWSGHQSTDGLIPATALPVIHATKTEARQLVEAGLWLDSGDGGWLINDWDEYQPSEKYRTQHARAVCTRWMKQGKDCTCGTHTPIF